MPLTTTTDIAADLQTYMAKQLLGHAKYQTVLKQFGHLEEIPEGNSKTIQFVQYADLAIVVNPLTEGQAPAGSKLTNTPITATVDQLGDFVTITDLAGLTPKHPTMKEAYRNLGTQAARSLDRQIFSAVSAGTVVRYAAGRAARNSLTATDYLVWADVRKEVSRLRTAGAQEFTEVGARNEKTGEIEKRAGDGNFVLVVDPSVEQDLIDDPKFAAAAQLQAAKDKSNELYTGTIARFAGVTVVRSNNLTTVTNTGSVVCHISLLFGMEAYACTDLQKLKTYKQGPGGVTDPLEQIMTIGWKAAAKSCILNNNWMSRLESASAY